VTYKNRSKIQDARCKAIHKRCLPPWILYLVSCIFFQTSQTSAENNVRVSILSLLKPQHLKLTLQSPATAMVKGGGIEQPWLEGKSQEIESINERLKSSIGITSAHLQIECSSPCETRIEVPDEMDRVYSGSLDFYYYNNTIAIVLTEQREKLISSIAASEMREVRDVEAIKAFAVVIRSFLVQSNRHPELHADFCDTTHCQVFQNLCAVPEVQEAVHQTDSLVLTYHDKMFRPYYSRACGGRTATYEEAWGKPPDGYEFRSVSCPCNSNSWKTTFSEKELSEISGLKTPTVLRKENQIVIFQGATQIPYSFEGFRSKVGKMYGWNRVPGNQYQIKRTSHGYEFDGIGSGHGVGFCQTGAEILAKRGASFTEILSHYFPATELKNR
jgi:stage II sporulation protein D (peptidoglycan lytic transglycosylase)